jgi:ADP-ribose pyrophosphatase
MLLCLRGFYFLTIHSMSSSPLPPSSPLWQGNSWQLVSRQIELDSGNTVEKAYIDHPGAVVLVPMLGDKVLMLRQYRIPLDRVILELPAGTRDPQEDWVVCAQRELREETGYRAEQLVNLGEMWSAPGVSNERMAIFLADGLSPAPLPQDEDEMIEVVAMPLAELVEMALSGVLDDAKSVVGVLWAERFVKNGG